MACKPRAARSCMSRPYGGLKQAGVCGAQLVRHSGGSGDYITSAQGMRLGRLLRRRLACLLTNHVDGVHRKGQRSIS